MKLVIISFSLTIIARMSLAIYKECALRKRLREEFKRVDEIKKANKKNHGKEVNDNEVL